MSEWFVVHHYDGDGITSGALFLLSLKEYPHVVSPPLGSVMDEYVYEKAKKSGAEKLAVLDISYSKSVEKLMELFDHVVYIDHHPSSKDAPADVLVHETENVSASYLTYRYVRDKVGERGVWIAAVGLISDKVGREDVIGEAERYVDRKTMGKIASLLNSARIYGDRGVTYARNAVIEAYRVGIPSLILGRTPNSKKLMRFKKISRREAYRCIREAEVVNYGPATVYIFSSRFPVQSLVASLLRPNYPVVAVNVGKRYVFMEARGEGAYEILRSIVGGAGSMDGHEVAAGATLSVEEWKRVKRKLGV